MEKNEEAGRMRAYAYVDNAEKLQLLAEDLYGAVRVGMDTEADSLHHYFEKVCLIQLSFSGKHYIVDPLAVFSLDPLWKVLAEKNLIFHAADYDLRMLKKSFGFQPQKPIFDTMLAAQMLGFDKIGLAAIVEKICGVILPKTGQKADWSRRPLTESLLQYASDDTKFLEKLTDAMTESLQKLGRLDWHRQSCERVVRNAGSYEKDETKELWRIKGSSKMSPRELIYLRELWKWRDEEARRKDRPPFMILRNEDLAGFAQWRAQNPAAHLSGGPIYVKRISGERLDHLKKALETAQNTPFSECPVIPERPARREGGIPPAEKVDALLMVCREMASKLQIESSVLASRSALTAVIQHRPQSIEEVMEVSGMMRWQAELMMPAIRTAFA